MLALAIMQISDNIAYLAEFLDLGERTPPTLEVGYGGRRLLRAEGKVESRRGDFRLAAPRVWKVGILGDDHVRGVELVAETDKVVRINFQHVMW